MIDIIAGVLLLVGGAFCLVAAIGLVRLPDVYTRMHAASKAGTLGSGIMILAIAIHAGTGDVALRAIAGILFFLLTAPISAHLLARAAYCSGLKPWSGTQIDELSGRYDRRSLRLESTPAADSPAPSTEAP